MASTVVYSTSLITYRKVGGWKYQLDEDFSTPTRCAWGASGGLEPPLSDEVEVEGFLRLDIDGTLHISAGYAWDGPSGPAVDTPAWMRGSLVHDALYQLIQAGKLPPSYRKPADLTMYDLLRLDGMSRFRATYSYLGVRLGGAPHAKPRPETLYTAGPKT